MSSRMLGFVQPWAPWAYGGDHDGHGEDHDTATDQDRPSFATSRGRHVVLVGLGAWHEIWVRYEGWDRCVTGHSTRSARTTATQHSRARVAHPAVNSPAGDGEPDRRRQLGVQVSTDNTTDNGPADRTDSSPGTKDFGPDLGEVFGPSHAAGGPTLVQLLMPEGERVEHPDFSLDLGDDEDEVIKGFYRDMVLTRRIDTEATALQRHGELGIWAQLLGQE